MFFRFPSGELDINRSTTQLVIELPILARLDHLPNIVEALDIYDRALSEQATIPRQDKIIFEACGIIRGAIPGVESGNFYIREALVPLVERFVKLTVDKAIARGQSPRFDPDATLLLFENAWQTRRFSKRQKVLEEASEFAASNPLGLTDNRYFVWVLNVSAYLQNLQRGEPFLLPVNEKTAKLVGTSTVTLSLAIKRAVSLDLLRVAQKADRMRGMSRLLRFNHMHPMVKSHMRAFNERVKAFRLEEHPSFEQSGEQVSGDDS